MIFQRKGQLGGRGVSPFVSATLLFVAELHAFARLLKYHSGMVSRLHLVFHILRYNGA